MQVPWHLRRIEGKVSTGLKSTIWCWPRMFCSEIEAVLRIARYLAVVCNLAHLLFRLGRCVAQYLFLVAGKGGR